MNQFSLGNNVDPTRIFLVNLSQVEGRIDPNAYHPDRLSAIEKLEESENELKKLKIIADFRKEKVSEIPNNDTQYVGLANIESNTGEFIPSEEKESISSASVFKKGDILFPKLRPYLNKIYLAEFDGICSTEFHVISSTTINKKFLAYFLRSDLVVKQTTRLMSGNTLPRVQTEDIYNLLIPIPSQEKQQKAVSVMQNANQLKAQKKAEAEKLLNSIDDYLLGELGIELPEKDNNLESRIFEISFQNISGIRLDPDYYSKYYKKLEKSICDSKFETKELSSLTLFLKGGKTPASSEYSNTKKTKFPIVKVGSYTNNYINFNKVGYTKSVNNSIQIEKDDIFILSAAHQAEYVGKHIKMLVEELFVPTSYVGELINVRANKSICNPIYLFSVLNLELFKTLINREKTGQTSHVYGKDLQYIHIPAPSLEKQNKIADHIRQLRKKAKQLKKEAQQAVEKARRQVEEIILEEN